MNLPALNPSQKAKMVADRKRTSVRGSAFKGDEAYAAITTATLALSAQTSKALDQLLVIRIDGFESRRNRLIVLTLVCLGLATYLISSFYVSDLRGFGTLATRMRKLAKGDLTLNFPARGRDEIGVLINSFNDSRYATRP